MPLMPLDFPPGIWRDDTQYRAEGKWYDCDKMRFRNGRPEMIGGWRNFSTGSNAFSTSSAMFPGMSMKYYGGGRVGLGCGEGFFLGSFDGITTATSIQAVTPASPAAVTLANNPFTDYTNAAFIQLTEANHKRRKWDLVTIAGATGFSGILAADLNRTFQISTIVDENTYIVEPITGSITYPGSAASGGGAAVTLTLSFNATRFDPFGASIREWSQVQYGTDFIFCDRDQAIYYYRSGTLSGNPAFFLCETNAASYPTWGFGANANEVPIMATGVEVGKDRSVIAFGANEIGSVEQDKMLVRWSDQENPVDWEPREDNTAGGFRLTWGSRIKAWINTKSEILIWTDTALVSMKWQGDPYFYSFDKIADNVPIIGMRSAVAVGDVVYWMGPDQFYRYNGAITPLPCTVQRYVFSQVATQINGAGPTQGTGVQTYFAGHNPQFNEVWFFCRTTTSPFKIYVIYNYLENVWAIGVMDRYAWTTADDGRVIAMGDSAANNKPCIFFHEYNYASYDNGSAANIAAYIESGAGDLGEGDRFQSASRFLPDHSTVGATGTLTYTLKGRNYSLESLSDLAVMTATATNSADKQKDIRARRRQFAIRISSSGNDFKWTLGKLEIDVQPDGGK